MVAHLQQVYSQYGADGVLEEAFRCIGVTTKVFVEIGTQQGVQCSSRHLRVAHGFLGYMFDDSYADERIGLQKTFMEPSFAASLVNSSLRAGDRTRGVPKVSSFQLDLLAMDTDGMDYVLWRSMCSKIRPRVLMLEAGWPAGPHWKEHTRLCKRISNLCRRCGYVLVHQVVHDMIFIRRDVLEASRYCRSFRHDGDLDFFVGRERARERVASAVGGSFGANGFTFEAMGVGAESLEQFLRQNV